MIQTVRITSKNQITIPVAFVKSLKLKKGDSLVMKVEDKKLIMQNPKDILNSLAGSIETPPELIGRDLDEIIAEAKDKHFSKKYAKLLR